MTSVEDQTATDQAGRRLVSLYFLMIFPWIFDFKSDSAGAGAALQGAMLLCYLFFFCLIVYSYSTIFRHMFDMSIFIFVSLVFVLGGSAVGLINGQPFYAIFVNMIPVFLYISSAYVTAQVLILLEGSASLERALKWLCLIFVVSHVLIVGATSGIDFAHAHYEVLGSSTIPALGLITVAMVSSVSFVDILIITANLGLVLLSVTRTLLVVAAAQFLTLLSAIGAIASARAVIILVLPAIVIGLDVLLGLGMTARWTQRLFVTQDLGVDPTSLSRIAEADFMKGAFTNSVLHFLFGNGLAAETSLIGPAAALASMAVGAESFEFHMIGFGHHNHWSLLFVGGVFIGLPLLFVQFWQGAKALLFLRMMMPAITEENYAQSLGFWGATIIIGMIAYGFYAGSFGDRGTSLWYGIGTGLMLGAYAVTYSTERSAA